MGCPFGDRGLEVIAHAGRKAVQFARRLTAVLAQLLQRLKRGAGFRCVGRRDCHQAAQLQVRQLVNGTAQVVQANGLLFRFWQTGNVQTYALSLSCGAIVILGYYLW